MSQGHEVDKSVHQSQAAVLEDGRLVMSDGQCPMARRFGKSLMISTLAAIFQSRRELFKGLAIDETDYDWKVHPAGLTHFNWARLIRPCIA